MDKSIDKQEEKEIHTGFYCPKCLTEMRIIAKIVDDELTSGLTAEFHECPKCGYSDFD